MKNILACAIAMAGCVAAGSALAQTCTASAGAIPLSGPNSLTTPITNFDTCGVTNQLGAMCSSATTSAATDAIWSVTLGPGAIGGATPPEQNFVISTSSGTYDMYVAIMQGSCADSAPCPREVDSAPAGGTESISIDGLAAGQYFLAVTSFTAGQCGPVTIAVPRLPVSLQNFSVE
ncbi:MAG: hypothetical protein KF811_02595 [Dokdonella sp.]|nr:hypothetical protein [Dokdonella sp.]